MKTHNCEEDRLRAALARVEKLAEFWVHERPADSGDPGWNNGYDARRSSDADLLRATLASDETD